MSTRDQFLAERAKGIGGSDVAAAAGYDPKKTRYQLWREKRGMPDPSTGKPYAMRRGNFLEPAILRRYAEVVQPAKLELAIPHAKGWRRGNQDGRATFADGSRVVVEAKSVNANVFRFTKQPENQWGEPWSDEVPRRALCQGLWYGALDDAQLIDFAVMVVPEDPDEVLGLTADEVVAVSEFHVFRAPRSVEVEGHLIEEAATLWQMVIDGVEPDPMTPDDVDLRWPVSVPDSMKIATPEVLKTIVAFEKAKAMAKEFGARSEQLRDELKLFAEGNEAICADDGQTPYLTMKSQTTAAHMRRESTSRPVKFTKWFEKHRAKIEALVAAAEAKP